MREIHVDDAGAGVPAIFVHGSFGWGTDQFPAQRQLRDRYRVLLVDRRGHGDSPAATEDPGWTTDARDVVDLLAEVGPAHLVGQSYGAVVALLVAGHAPELVRSLVAIEPPLFELAAGVPEVDAIVRDLKPIYARAENLTAAAFLTAWGVGLGQSAEGIAARTATFGERDWAAAEATRRDRWPGDAPVAFDVLAAAPFPKILVAGGWSPDAAPGRQPTGKAFRAVCQVVAERIRARVVVFEGSAHNPQLQEPERFNELLRDVWGAADSELALDG